MVHSQCPTCEKESVDCMRYIPTISDFLLKTLPEYCTYGNIHGSVGRDRLANKNWGTTVGADDFLSEEPKITLPEDFANVTKNPFRTKVSAEVLESVMSCPLKAAIERGRSKEDLGGGPLELPSSQLLESINRSITKYEADQKRPADLNEAMSGSALLALGVIVQEHCRFMLE
ncbi:hypothetical protein FBU59_003621 [Linderina macrospora]|uniref:Uncharacterized protein n=1 Tax=Linderina macrospora TaxID=4868 RepID=A0ACC1J800_9FUNG|nr:hypothetical protein FBU59_003621 [Linderina macrospora]